MLRYRSGLHVDLVHGKDDVAELHNHLPADWLLSAGLINGRNVWRADLTEKYAQIKDLVGKRELWVASSCSLLHSPIDLSVETRLDAEVKSWFAFALQKCGELALLRDALNSGDTAAITEWSAPIGPSPFDPRAQRGGGKTAGGDHCSGQPARQPL